MSTQTFSIENPPTHNNPVVVIVPKGLSGYPVSITAKYFGSSWIDCSSGSILNGAFDNLCYWFDLPPAPNNANNLLNFPTFFTTTPPDEGQVVVVIISAKADSKETPMTVTYERGIWKLFPTRRDVSEMVKKADFWFYYKDLQNYMIAKRQQAKKEKTC